MRKIENNILNVLQNKVFLIILSLFVATLFLILNFSTFTVNAEVFAPNATSFIVIDANSKAIIKGQNIDERLPIASTTKIMTAILAIENLNLEKCIFINKNAVGVEGSSIYLNADTKYKIKDLVYGLMLRSGNDAAEALAYEVSGSIEAFSDLMNKKVKELGLNNTHFVNPHGLHDENHYSSAYDLAIISAYAIKNPIFKKIVSSSTHLIEEGEGVFYNKNKMLKKYDGANGIKTGFTKNAGRCLVSSACRNGVQVISVVLNCPNMWEDSINLLDFAFSKYDFKNLITKNKKFLSFADNGLYMMEDLIIGFEKDSNCNIEYQIKLNSNLDLPIDKNSEIGVIDVYRDKHLLFSRKIYNINIIENIDELDKLYDIINKVNYDKT